MQSKLDTRFNSAYPGSYALTFEQKTSFTFNDDKRINLFKYLKDGRIAITWDDYEEQTELEIYDPTNNFHLDMKIPFEQSEAIWNMVELDNGTLIIFAAIPLDEYQMNLKVMYKMINLNKDSFTMNSYVIQEETTQMEIQSFLYPIQGSIFVSFCQKGELNIWNGVLPFNTTPIKKIIYAHPLFKALYCKKGNYLLIKHNEPIIIDIMDMNTYEIIHKIENLNFRRVWPFDENRLLYSNVNPNIISYFFMDKGNSEKIENLDENEVTDILTLRDGNLLLLYEKENKIVVYDIKKKKWSISLEHDSNFDEFYPRDNYSFATIDNNKVFLWKY